MQTSVQTRPETCLFFCCYSPQSFLQVKKDHTSAPRSVWQTRTEPPLKGETHKDRHAHPHPQACAYISQPHIAEESATPCLCLSLYILWSVALAKLTCSLCRHPGWLTHLFFFGFVLFFFALSATELDGRSQSLAGRASASLSSSCQSVTPPTPVMQRKEAYDFHSAAPRRQSGGSPQPESAESGRQQPVLGLAILLSLIEHN